MRITRREFYGEFCKFLQTRYARTYVDTNVIGVCLSDFSCLYRIPLKSYPSDRRTYGFLAQIKDDTVRKWLRAWFKEELRLFTETVYVEEASPAVLFRYFMGGWRSIEIEYIGEIGSPMLIRELL
jgi:hypothetical protein